MAKCCGTCRHFGAPPTGARNKTFACKVPIPEPALPASVTRSHDYRWPPSRNYMGPKDGANCPTWQSRETPLNSGDLEGAMLRDGVGA